MTDAPETRHRTNSSPTTVAEDNSLPSETNTLIDAVIAALRTVRDPEIPVNIFDLGLVYRTEIKDPDVVEIDMTLTAPGCPVAGDIVANVRRVVLAVEGINDVTVKLVFDPPWDRAMMSEEAKLELGFIDVS